MKKSIRNNIKQICEVKYYPKTDVAPEEFDTEKEDQAVKDDLDLLIYRINKEIPGLISNVKLLNSNFIESSKDITNIEYLYILDIKKYLIKNNLLPDENDNYTKEQDRVYDLIKEKIENICKKFNSFNDVNFHFDDYDEYSIIINAKYYTEYNKFD